MSKKASFYTNIWNVGTAPEKIRSRRQLTIPEPLPSASHTLLGNEDMAGDKGTQTLALGHLHCNAGDRN